MKEGGGMFRVVAVHGSGSVISVFFSELVMS